MSEINNEREKIQDTKERKDSVDCENLGDAVGGKKKRNVKKSLFKKIVVGCIVCVLVICAILILPKILNPDGGKVTTITKSSLEKVIEINDMSTLDYTYNPITDVKDENGKEKYHVAYEGKVTAGIDITKINISVDEQNKKILIVVPEAKIQSIDVNMGTMEFIFDKEKYETETVSQEAYKASLDDLEKKANSEKDLLSMAKENAVDAITALITPWVEQIDEQYTVEIK